MEEKETARTEKDAILKQRKELKKRAHQVTRGHYVLLVFLLLIMALFGREFRGSLAMLEPGPAQSQEQTDENGRETNNPGNVFSADDVITSDMIFTDIIQGKLEDGSSKAATLLKRMTEEDAPKELGRTNGVLAQLVNAIGSGQLFVKLAQSLRSIFRSEQAVSVIFVIGAFLWYALIFILFKNMLGPVIRRIFLQARVYENVSFMDVTYIAAVKKWFQAAWVLLVEYIYSCLWMLTVVGWFIKTQSYWAVPYIVAENPSLGAGEAITLSRKMMDGHKWEHFKFECTYILWYLLSFVTLGFSDLFYGAAYRLAGETEFYVKVREDAIRRNVPGIEALYDSYLYAKADRILLYETYFEVVDEITLLHEGKIVLSGVQKFLSEWFGIWFGSLRSKKAYEDQEGRILTIEHYKMSMAGKAYPEWLNPLWPRKEIHKKGNVTYLRSYSVWTLFLLFISFAFVGWSWEVALHFIQTGLFANRGTLHGPWLPIYGTGGVIVLILCAKFRKKPVVEFFTAIALCGVLEYFSSVYLEMKYHQRWWSYDGYFLNLNGRICAEGLLVFGVGCCAVVYLVAPLFDAVLSRVKHQILIGACAVLGVAYVTDMIYSREHPNMAEGAIEAPVEAETEELTEQLLTEQLPEGQLST